MLTTTISMKSCWTRLYSKLSKWRPHPSMTIKRKINNHNYKSNLYGNSVLQSSFSSQQGERDQKVVQQDQQRRQSMYPCLASHSSTHPPMAMSTVSGFFNENEYEYYNDDDDEEEDNNDSINTQAFSSAFNLSTNACYSNFYLRLNNGKYMVRVRTAERVIIGSYIIDEHM
ncbi:hypothetical protein BDC45DRAFT_519763, partial [Circinella umbellata]